MTDKELLELAATAMQRARHPDFANFTVDSDSVCLDLGCRRGAVTSYWSPLTDDGDALRLAVHLQVDIKQYGDCVVAWHKSDHAGSWCISYDGKPCAATRRAIVRAAAEIGKTTP